MRKRSREIESDDYPEFFKVYLPDLCSEKLRIPPAFVKHLEGDLPQMSVVESPAGSWHVNVKEMDNKLFFDEGWKEFAQENSLEHGDFLTLSYVSKSRFYVKIYGKNSCRKEIAKSPSAAKIDDKEVQMLLGDQTSKHVGTTGMLNTPQLTAVEHQKTDQPPQTDDELALLSCRTFEMTMSPTYINKCLFLPAVFTKTCKRCSAASEGIVTLRVGNRSWSMKVHCCRDRFNLSRQGWCKFVEDNSLQIGDVCRFNLIDHQKFVLEISISR